MMGPEIAVGAVTVTFRMQRPTRRDSVDRFKPCVLAGRTCLRGKFWAPPLLCATMSIYLDICDEHTTAHDGGDGSRILLPAGLPAGIPSTRQVNPMLAFRLVDAVSAACAAQRRGLWIRSGGVVDMLKPRMNGQNRSRKPSSSMPRSDAAEGHPREEEGENREAVTRNRMENELQCVHRPHRELRELFPMA